MDSLLIPAFLCVEDDPRRLELYQRLLAPLGEVLLARQASEALEQLRRRPAAVVLVDLRLPVMDGLALLAQVQKELPFATRMLLAPAAASDEAARALNDQRIWRYLLKPFQDLTLAQTAELALLHHRQCIEEESLIERTLHSCVRLLTDLLGRAQPEAFGRAHRIRGHMAALARDLGLAETRPFEFAGMLAQLGRLSLPPHVQEKLARGSVLSPSEQQAFDNHPKIAAELLAEIPRLETVAKIVARQNLPVAELPGLRNGVSLDPTSMGAAMLKVALDFDQAVSSGEKVEEVLDRMQRASEKYEPHMVQSMRRLEAARRALRRMSVSFGELAPGMILLADLRTQNGILVLPKGQELGAAALPRLQRFAENYGVVEPIEVLAAARVDDPSAPLPTPRSLAQFQKLPHR